jgi:hypothetical protein
MMHRSILLSLLLLLVLLSSASARRSEIETTVRKTSTNGARVGATLPVVTRCTIISAVRGRGCPQDTATRKSRVIRPTRRTLFSIDYSFTHQPLR